MFQTSPYLYKEYCGQTGQIQNCHAAR